MNQSKQKNDKGIPEGWGADKIINVIDTIFSGGTPDTRKKEYWDGNIPWLSSGETGNRFIYKTEKTITDEGVNNSSTRLARKGDVVIASAGQGYTRGQTAYCQIDTYINQSIVVLRTNEQRLDSQFLFYNLLSRYEELRQISDGHSSRGSLTTKLLANLDIKFPKFLEEQAAIAKILFDLDTKIELNRQMNETLEQMARTIFKRWFVDFEFPGLKKAKFVDGLPEGWRIGKISDEFNLTMGQSPPGETYNEKGDGMPFFQGRTDFGFRYPSIRMFCSAPTRFAQADDTLVSVRAPVGAINMANRKCCIGRGLAAIRHKSSSRSYSYYCMRSMEEIFKGFEAEGTVFGSLTKDSFGSIKVIVPPEEIVTHFEEAVYALDQKIENNEKESQVLITIRDALLPKLMSGEIRTLKHEEEIQ